MIMWCLDELRLLVVAIDCQEGKDDKDHLLNI